MIATKQREIVLVLILLGIILQPQGGFEARAGFMLASWGVAVSVFGAFRSRAHSLTEQSRRLSPGHPVAMLLSLLLIGSAVPLALWQTEWTEWISAVALAAGVGVGLAYAGFRDGLLDRLEADSDSSSRYLFRVTELAAWSGVGTFAASATALFPPDSMVKIVAPVLSVLGFALTFSKVSRMPQLAQR